MSRAELSEISEGMIDVYFAESQKEVIDKVDIEDFITSFLGLSIEYVSFAEPDHGRIGFLSDGETPLLISRSGKIIPFVFPDKTIVLDKILLEEKEIGRRRFTLAHEAAHYILGKMNGMDEKAKYHSDYDKEKSYSMEELSKMFAAAEWQADAMAACLLMPSHLIDKVMARCVKKEKIKVYGDNILAFPDKRGIREMAKHLEVSYTSLLIRLRDLNKFEYHDIQEYISNELNLGGTGVGCTNKERS